jgi:hypothetical protein
MSVPHEPSDTRSGVVSLSTANRPTKTKETAVPDTRPLEIPVGLDRWHPNEITEWLTGVEDETIADADVHRACQAVNHALGVG